MGIPKKMIAAPTMSAIGVTRVRGNAQRQPPGKLEGPTTVNSGVPPLRSVASAPDPEVPAKAVRRRFTAEYKLRVLRAADGCTTPGEVGALLRREGLYSSHLTTWRRQREQGALAALTPKPRGRPAVPPHPLARRVAELERETARLQRRLKQAETIIEVQKKVSEILGIPLERPDDGEAA